MAELPSVTVTFLFCDVEGSTALLKDLGRGEYGRALADFQRLVRQALATSRGHEVDTQGDSFFFAFRSAADAAAGAAQAQRSLAAHAWPDGKTLKVRIGIRSGEASVAEDRYVGVSVHRAARICAAAAGGQVLLSQAAASVLEDEGLGELSVRDIGERRLKDFDRPVRLYQLEGEGLEREFPRPKALGKRFRSRRTLLLAGAAILVAAAVAVPLTLLGGDSSGLTKIGPTSVGVIDPKTNELVDEIDLGFEAPLIAAGEGYVWLVSPERSTLTEIDPKTRKVLATTGIEAGGIPTGLAVGEGAVWVSVNRVRTIAVYEIGPALGDLRRSIVIERVPRLLRRLFPVPLAVGDGSVWALDTGELTRIDPGSGRAVWLTSGLGGLSIAVGHGAVWVGTAPYLKRLDPSTGAVLASIPVAVAFPGDLSEGLGGSIRLRIDAPKRRLRHVGEPYGVGVDSHGKEFGWRTSVTTPSRRKT